MSIWGDYPCCGGDLCLSLPDNAPGFAPEDCPHCGARVWHWFSRLNPESWTEADFLERYEVDPAERTVKRKGADGRELSPAIAEMADQAADRVAAAIVAEMLEGSPKR